MGREGAAESEGLALEVERAGQRISSTAKATIRVGGRLAGERLLVPVRPRATNSTTTILSKRIMATKN